MKPRKKLSSSSATLAVIWLALGFAAIPSHAATDWEAKYKEICSYDGMCGKLKSASEWTAPAADIVDVLRTSRPLILAAAKLYGVDPRARVHPDNGRQKGLIVLNEKPKVIDSWASVVGFGVFCSTIVFAQIIKCRLKANVFRDVVAVFSINILGVF